MIVDMFRVGVFLGFLLTCSIGLSETLPLELFPHSDSTYSCFRIPALVTLKSGVLVVFAEGRRGSCNDFGHVDIVMRRSEDKGKSWTTQKVVASFQVLGIFRRVILFR